jgi:hypothetical protein
MTRAGRVVHVQFVLTSTLVYHAMALDIPSWAIKAIDKIHRSYLWRGRKEAKGGHCLLAWPKVTRPKELGGLGLSDLQSLNWALRVRWVWLKKTNSSKPWVAFQLQSSAPVQDLFKMAMASEIGDGTETLFWKDRWLNGQRLEDLAPHVSRLVPKRIANRRTVADALDNTRWAQDLHGTITWLVIQEFLLLWDLLAGVILMPGATKKVLKGARFGTRKREAGALRLTYTPRRALSGDARLGGTGGAEAARKRGRGAEAARKRGESRQRAQNREA